MSLAPQKLNVVKVQEATINFESERTYVVLEGANQVTYQTFPAANTNTDSINIRCNPPSERVGVDRNAYLRSYIQLDVTGPTANPEDLVVPGNGVDAPRAFPVMSCCTSMRVSLNGTAVNLDMNEFLHGLMKYANRDDLRDEVSTCPNYPDSYQEYNDYLDPQAGAARNPLGPYGANGYWGPRGGFPLVEVASTVTTGSFRFVSTEPLMLAPFLKSGFRPGLVGLRTMVLQMQIGDLTRAWSHGVFTSGGPVRPAFTTIAVSFYQAPELLMRYVSPASIISIPAVNSYAYSDIIHYNSSSQPLNAGVSADLNAGNIQLGQIPEAIYVFARRDNADRTYLTTDTFARMNSINITFNNQSSVLSAANEQDLYRIAARNGFIDSFESWHSFAGSVLKLIPGQDFGLNEPGMAPGVLMSMNLNVRANITNLSSLQRNLVLYVVIQNEGSLVIDGSRGSVTLTTGDVTREDVLNAPRLSIDIEEARLRSKMARGGGLFSSLRRGLRRALDFGKKLGITKAVLKKLAKNIPFSSEILDVADIVSGVVAAPKKKGRGIIGGAMVSRRDL